MSVNPTLLVIWSVCTAVFFALLMYRGHLTRQEVDVLFLNENVDETRELEHDDIVRRVQRVDPFLKAATVAVAFMTVLVIGLYIAKILPTVRF